MDFKRAFGKQNNLQQKHELFPAYPEGTKSHHIINSIQSQVETTSIASQTCKYTSCSKSA